MPLHGKHPNVEIREGGQIRLLACCDEFHELMGNIINDFQKKHNRLLIKIFIHFNLFLANAKDSPFSKSFIFEHQNSSELI